MKPVNEAPGDKHNGKLTSDGSANIFPVFQKTSPVWEATEENWPARRVSCV